MADNEAGSDNQDQDSHEEQPQIAVGGRHFALRVTIYLFGLRFFFGGEINGDWVHFCFTAYSGETSDGKKRSASKNASDVGREPMVNFN
jgi:hypothetical protein